MHAVEPHELSNSVHVGALCILHHFFIAIRSQFTHRRHNYSTLKLGHTSHGPVGASMASALSTIRDHVDTHSGCVTPHEGRRMTEGKRGGALVVLTGALAEDEADEFSSRSMNPGEPACE